MIIGVYPVLRWPKAFTQLIRRSLRIHKLGILLCTLEYYDTVSAGIPNDQAGYTRP
jgi:hypothetical protein